MPVAWSGTDDNGASWKLYEPDGKQRQAVNYGTGNGKVKVQLRTNEFDRVGKSSTTPAPPLHPKPSLHPLPSCRTSARVAFLQSRACPSVLSRLGRVLPVGCDDLESMDCTETALQPA